eukprot:TRINITY_DN8588_c0_g2_i10.p2 TRINITY_DN8588_c0_g2~~TRINITY_DN8588_c0_g2_i10.p2  ORF type:complete len:206 (+),score=79.23 TRINITY_DN8588_c0_g2_i10:1937-2554(+)
MLNGTYKSTGKKFIKPFGVYVFKFAKLLIEQAVNSDKVNEYLNSVAAWKEFENTTYKTRMEQDRIKLGGMSDKKEEDDDEDLNARDEDFNSRELFDKADEKDKFNIMPGDDEEDDKGPKLDTEEATETLIDNEKGKISFEEVTEEIINADVEDGQKPKVLLEDMEDSDVEPESVIGKFSNDFAENNYWKERPEMDLKALEEEYEL